MLHIFHYQTDLLYIYYYVGLSTTFVNQSNTDYGNENILIERLLPEVFLQNILVTGLDKYCILPSEIRPRMARLYTIAGDYVDVPIAFAGGTANFRDFIRQILSNSEVAAYDIIPERIRARRLEYLLTRNGNP